MNNHLSYRWPKNPPPQPPVPKRRRTLRTALIVAACVLGAAAIIAGAFFGVMHLAERSVQRPDPPVPSHSPAPRPSLDLSGWSPDELPWGEPDPAVQITLAPPPAQTMTPAQLYEQALPSVVCVQGVAGWMSSTGSGVILTSSGYIVTNYHVIEGCDELSVMLLSDQSVYDAVVIGYDEELDIAVLKVEAEGLTPARLGDSDRLSVGDAVYAIGNPLGYLYGSMTEGIVSALPREVDVDSVAMTLLQTSAALNSGNSGGALVDSFGQVVGIPVAKLTGMEDEVVTEGIGLVIPLSDALPFINHILRTGESCRPGLGIQCYVTRQDGQAGILVDSVTPGTPAVGVLQKGDLIIAANGRQTDTLYRLTRTLYDTGVDSEIELTVVRDGEVITLSLVLYDRLEQVD